MSAGEKPAPKATKKPPVALTPAQRAEVASLVADEGYTRREAVTWVLSMPAEVPS